MESAAEFCTVLHLSLTVLTIAKEDSMAHTHLQQARGYLGSYNPKSGAFKEWLSPGGTTSAPYGIAIAPDGRVFYDEARSGNIIAFDRKTEKAEMIKIPTPGSIVRNMSVDSTRNRLWLALSGISRIGKIELK